MATFVPSQPRPAVVLAPRDKARRPPAPHHHALYIPHGLPVPYALPATISSERSCQRARLPALEECDGVEVVDFTGFDQEGRTQERQVANDSRSEADGDAHNVDSLFCGILTGLWENPPLQAITAVRALTILINFQCCFEVVHRCR